MEMSFFHLPGSQLSGGYMKGGRQMRHLKMKGRHRVLVLPLGVILYEPSQQLRSADRTCQKVSKSGGPSGIDMHGIKRVI